MQKNILKEIILRQQEFIAQVQLVRRDIRIEPAGNYVLVGLRRAGKTYMLYQYNPRRPYNRTHTHQPVAVKFLSKIT